jgi:nucleotide-binding universal stress UspA family protein
MKKILVGVDGSDESMKATRMAMEIAGADGSVTLAYCIVPLIYPSEMMWTPPVDFEPQQLKAAEQVLDSMRKTLSASAVRLDGVVLRGPAAETLANEATAKGYDLVAVGTHGYGTVKRMLLGSVSGRLVHICQKPTLVVR